MYCTLWFVYALGATRLTMVLRMTAAILAIFSDFLAVAFSVDINFRFNYLWLLALESRFKEVSIMLK